MSPDCENALKLLDAIAAQAPMGRDGHIAAQQALKVLQKALGAPESPPNGFSVPEQVKA